MVECTRTNDLPPNENNLLTSKTEILYLIIQKQYLSRNLSPVVLVFAIVNKTRYVNQWENNVLNSDFMYLQKFDMSRQIF